MNYVMLMPTSINGGHVIVLFVRARREMNG